MRQREGLSRDIGAVQLPSGAWLDYSRGLRFVTPTASLYDAVSTLTRFRIHRLPVLDPDQNCIVSICTHMHVLQYLVLRFREQRRLFDHGIRALGIGTFGRIVTAGDHDSLIHVLDLMATHRVSGVPVINGDGAVTDIYMRHYIIHMARERSPTAHLHTPVGALLRDWNELVRGRGPCRRRAPLSCGPQPAVRYGYRDADVPRHGHPAQRVCQVCHHQGVSAFAEQRACLPRSPLPRRPRC